MKKDITPNIKAFERNLKAFTNSNTSTRPEKTPLHVKTRQPAKKIQLKGVLSELGCTVKFAEAYSGQIPATCSIGIRRTIQRNGVCVGGKYYFSDEMISRLGQPVLVKILKHDELIAFFSTNGIILGTGQPAGFRPSASLGSNKAGKKL